MTVSALIILSILTLVPLAFGQQPAPPSLGMLMRKPQTFAPAEEEFSTESIAIFTPNLRNHPELDKTLSRGYHAFMEGTYYYVFSDNIGDPSQVKTVLSFIGQKTDNISQNKNFIFADEFGFYHKVLIFSTSARVYAFQTVSPTKDNPAVEQFFTNLKINGLTPKIEKNVVWNQPLPSDIEYYTLLPKINSSTGNAAALPAENKTVAADNGSGNAQPTPVQTTLLTLQAKPRAEYTDYAKFYELEGYVRVRVTFGADGKIGKLWVTNKLPFGLISTSLDAAKKLEFTPATENGKPVTQIKIIEYSFSIY